MNGVPYVSEVVSLYRRRAERARLLATYGRFREYTMLPAEDYVDTMRLAIMARSIAGCVVECGVWKGGVAAGLASILGGQRRYILLDSFEGLPEAQEIDGPAAQRWQADVTGPNYHDNCAAPPEFVMTAMNRAGISEPQIIRGWYDQTLPLFEPQEPIAFLHLDSDWYASTMVCLEHLFDHVADGGLIVLDDYYAWDGCSRAVHEFLSRRQGRERVRSLGNVSYIRRLPMHTPAPDEPAAGR